MSDSEWRALTLRQPWAFAVAHLGKNVENRTWPVPSTVSLPSRVMIHAGHKIDDDFARLIVDARFRDHVPPAVMLLGASTDPEVQASVGMDRGVVVAVATITGCHRDGDTDECWTGTGADKAVCSPWAEGPPFGEDVNERIYHWTLADVTPLSEPVPAKGRQGLWKPDAALIAAIEGSDQ